MDFRKYVKFWKWVGVDPNETLFNAKIWFGIIVFGSVYLYQIYEFVKWGGFFMLIPFPALFAWLWAYQITFELVLTPFLWIRRIRGYTETMSPFGEFLLAWAMVALIYPVCYGIFALWIFWYGNPKTWFE